MAITNSNSVINTLLKSSTGKKLYEEAQKKGVKINFTGSDNSGELGNFNPNNNTITVKSGSMETMVETLGHELLHATTKDNGNSMNEEKEAFKVGEKISQESGVNYNPHSDSFWNNHVDKAYAGDGLKKDNGIASAMSAMGINDNIASSKGVGNIFSSNNTNCSNSSCGSGTNSLATLANTNPFNPQNGSDILLALMEMLMNMTPGGQNSDSNLSQQNINNTMRLFG